MRSVSVVGIGQLPVEKATDLNLRQLGGEAVRRALEDAGVDRVDALYASNMLADEMQGQKHIAFLNSGRSQALRCGGAASSCGDG